MSSHGKKYLQQITLIDKKKSYNLSDGIDLSLKCKYAKFDESLDISVRLGVDPRQADQMIRSTLILPHGTGKTERVLVFAKGDKEKEAIDAGADYAGSDEYIEKIQNGWLDFEKTIATPDLMGLVGKIGRILGPRGLMPNAKLGTVTFDVARVIKEIKSGKIDFKVDKAGVIHSMLGKTSFGKDKLKDNVIIFIDKILQLKPSTAKGVYIRSIYLSTTMGPSIKIDTSELRSLTKVS